MTIKRRVEKIEQETAHKKYAMAVTVHNYKEGDPLPDNVGPNTTIVNLIDPKKGRRKHERPQKAN